MTSQPDTPNNKPKSMSSFFAMGDGSTTDKEKEDTQRKHISVPKSIKRAMRVSKSFDLTGGGGSKGDGGGGGGGGDVSPQPKRSSIPKLFGGHSNNNTNHDDSTGQLMTDGSARTRMGDFSNKAANTRTGQVMRSAVFAPVVAGKAMVQGGVKAVQGSVKAGQLVVDQSIKTTTNIAKAAENTVISGSKAVVGGGKALVGGTSSVVEYGGKRLVKGTKGVVNKGIKSLKSFSSRNLEEKKSKWEKGIEVIESLLEPGSATCEAMSAAQRKELAMVKKLLITGPGGEDKTAHIPRDLIKMKRRESVGGDRRLSSNFILQEFAGLKDASILEEAFNVDTSDSSDEVAPFSSPIGGSNRTRSKSPVRRSRKPVKRENSNSSVASLASLQHGFGNLGHDDPALDVNHFVPVEFTKISKDHQLELYNMLSWNSINKWEFDIFRLDKITKRRPLLFMGWAILGSPYAQSAMANHLGLDYKSPQDEIQGYGFMEEFMIPPQKLCDYLRVIELDYRAENPYHNAIHAADVMQSLHTLIQMSLDEEFLIDCPRIKIFTILLAAAIHDVDHPGKTNAFHTNSRTELAVMYNDTSVLENWHVAHAFARMLNIKLKGSEGAHDSVVMRKSEENNHSDTNFLCNTHPEQFKIIRNLMIEAVLHTDMTKHFAMVNTAKGLFRQHHKEENTWKVLMFMLHMADISGQAKAAPLFTQWTERCMNEFFAQGDEERTLGLPISPNCDRDSTITAESQVGFIKFVVEPAYEVLGLFVPFVQSRVLGIIEHNLHYWVDQMENGPYETKTVQMDDSSRWQHSERKVPPLDEAQPTEPNSAACKEESLATTNSRARGRSQVEV